MDEKNLEKKIQGLEKQLKQKDAYIEHLEKLSEAYTNLSELFNKELIDADRTLKAQEIIQNMMTEEKKQAEETIKAHEFVEQLSMEEKKQAEETIRAHEQLQGLTVMEKKEAEKIIHAQEMVTTLSYQELTEKDKALHLILEINKNISSLLDLNQLLEAILNGLLESTHAERGIVFLLEKSKLTAQFFKNMDPKEIKKDYFKGILACIQAAEEKKTGQIAINQTVLLDGRNQKISYLCVPMIYKDSFYGVLYADILSQTDNFKENDLALAEIFSSQASISINNASLYEKMKLQNHELLKQTNLNNQFINHLSKDLIYPFSEIIRHLENILEKPSSSKEENESIIKSIANQLKKIQNTIDKVFTVKALEAEVDDLFKDSINFQALFDEIFSRHGEVIRKKRLSLTVELTKDFESYNANKTIMNVIFDELLSNASFYNREGGSISVKGSTKENYLVIDIIDTGIGIKNSDLESVFQQFYRTEDSERMNECGAGLGLYMVKESLKYYGGNVSLQSIYGKGSQFTVRFLI